MLSVVVQGMKTVCSLKMVIAICNMNLRDKKMKSLSTIKGKHDPVICPGCLLFIFSRRYKYCPECKHKLAEGE